MPDDQTDILSQSTKLDANPSGFSTQEFSPEDFQQAGAGKGMTQLVANYNAIQDAKAIYYPVAYRFVKELGPWPARAWCTSGCGKAPGAQSPATPSRSFDPGIYPECQEVLDRHGPHRRPDLQAYKPSKAPTSSPPTSTRNSTESATCRWNPSPASACVTCLTALTWNAPGKTAAPAEWASFTDVIFRIKNGKIAIQPGVVVYIMRRVLRALESLARNAGFIHCDVKPANVMIDQLGYVKLIDYGRATLVNEKVSLPARHPGLHGPGNAPARTGHDRFRHLYGRAGHSGNAARRTVGHQTRA
jgi:hypothetical protein